MELQSAEIPKLPEVSVIIPARNEEMNLGRCLDSIVHQEGVTFEVIVSDDNSTDGTARIAASYPQVVLVEPGPLPLGWSGKSYAISKAILKARGKWLLFTDADTIHKNTSIAVGMHEAIDKNAAMLSYSPYQIAITPWERLLQPVVFAELNFHFNYDDVNDPGSKIAAANGQYILLRKDIYNEVGGHQAVKNDLLEDVALARIVKARGERLWFRYAPDVIGTRMYRSLGQLWEGWTKNLALLFDSPLRMALVRIVEFALFVGGVAVAIEAFSKQAFLAGLLGIVSATFAFSRIRMRFKRGGFGAGKALVGVLGLPLFSAVLINAYLNTRLLKRAKWKGRTYSATIDKK